MSHLRDMTKYKGLFEYSAMPERWYKQGIRFSPFLVSCFCLVVLLPAGLCAADEIKSGETLDLAWCITIALKNHPIVLGAVGSLKASQIRVNEARANYYPQVGASSSYSRNYAQGGMSAAAPGVTNYNQYQDALSLNQTIFDFGKTSAQVDVQALGADSSRADLENMLSQIILGVKQAYYGILQARQSRDAYAETVVQFQQHLDQAKRFYEVGTKPKIDVTNAEVDLSQAKLTCSRRRMGCG